MKNKIRLLLAMLLLGTLLMCSVQAEVAPDFAWELSEAGTLTICGHGEMPEYSQLEAITPWEPYADTIRQVVIEDGLTSICSFAFYSTSYKYSSLERITLPDSVTSIGEHAFDNCTGLTSIILPDSVTTIGDYAFENCIRLNSITLPDGVTAVGGRVFSGCTGLTGITLPDSIISICNFAFAGCTKLTDIAIPDRVTAIGSYAFAGCSGLTSITLPDSVTTIDSFAFSACTGLTNILIPEGVTTIGHRAFACYTSVNEKNPHFSSDENGVLFDKNKTRILSAPIAITGAYSVPDGVTSIEDNAFSDCTRLTGITLPDSVTSIGENAFVNCTGLTNVTLSNRVTAIGRMAFSGCTGLTNVTLSDSLTSIANFSFSCCTGLTNITIPPSVISIGYEAFSGCTSLTDITIPNSVKSIDTYAFVNCTTLTKVYYTGTEEEWYTVTKDSAPLLNNATLHFNYVPVPPITVLLNSVPVSFPDQQPVLKDSRTLVPARGVFEALGATVGWDDATQTVTVERGETLVTLTIGESYITVNGERKEQDVPALLINSRAMIPVRAVAEAFFCTVGWDGDTYTVIIDG